MKEHDIRFGLMSRDFIDGVPLDLASRLLPKKTRFNFQVAAHIHLHARAQSHANPASAVKKPMPVSKTGLTAMIDGMLSLVRSMSLGSKRTTWNHYYEETNYTATSMASKKAMVGRMLDRIEEPIRTIWDLGSNVGEMSVLGSERGIDTIGLEMDAYAVEEAYKRSLAAKDEHFLPLVQDFTNPSPRLGWANSERDSLLDRGPADVAFALALVHHLAIGNNVPLPSISAFLAQCAKWLILEFVPKEDSQVQRMLSSREDIFSDYTESGLEVAFKTGWTTEAKERIQGTARTLYLLKRRGD